MSDQTLRAALERLLSTYDDVHGGHPGAPGSRERVYYGVGVDLRALLATHPAEPAQDDDMTAEEFDRRLTAGTPVELNVNLGRTYTRTVATQPAPVASDHFVRVEFDGYRDSVDLLFICKAAPDAPCHMVCPRECEECDHPRTQQVDYCNPGEFISNGGDGVISQAERQDWLVLPVDTSWNGDTYVWKVRNEPGEPNG